MANGEVETVVVPSLKVLKAESLKWTGLAPESLLCLSPCHVHSVFFLCPLCILCPNPTPLLHMCAFMCMHAHMCRGQKWAYGVFLKHSPPCCFEDLLFYF